MEKLKALTLFVAVLLVVNIGALGFIFLGQNRLPQGEGFQPREIIISRLHFNTSQVAQYDGIINGHRNAVRNLDDKIRMAKNELYAQLKDIRVDPIKSDSLIHLLSVYQNRIEVLHFNHFKDIKKICTKEQLKDFDALTEEFSIIFSRRPKPAHD